MIHLKNFLNKREQSQARLSFAECEKSRLLAKTLLTLVALFAMTTGAWAQTETLLTTITATGDKQASYSTANVATVSFSYTQYGSLSYTAIWGWWGYDMTLTVTPAEGYTITKCIFYDDKDRTATDSEAPFVVETTEEDKTPKVNGTPILADESKGIKKIEVYGYVTPAAPAGTALTPDATRTVWTLDAMPAGNVELQVAYFPGMLTLPAKTAQGSIEVVGLGLGTTSFTAPSEWKRNSTKLTSGHFEGFKSVTEEEAKAWPSVPATGLAALYYNYDETAQKWDMIYFKDGAFFDIYKGYAQQLSSVYNLSTSDFSVFYTTGMQMPAGFDTDGTNYYVEPKTQFQVKAVPAEGYHLVSLSDGTNTYDVDADGIATITMPEGDADLTLTATFSDEFELTFDDVNFKTNQNITVKVGDADKTLDQDGKLSVKSGQTVTLTAKQGYKFRDVSVKKAAPALLSLQVCGQTIYYAEGETWGDAIKNHPTENAGWNLDGDGYVNHDSFGYLLVSNDFVPGNTPIDPNATYSCTGI